MCKDVEVNVCIRKADRMMDQGGYRNFGGGKGVKGIKGIMP